MLLKPDVDIGIAVLALKAGRRVARRGWNGKDMWLALQVPDAQSKMTLPYVYMRTAQGGLIPWLCSQADLLAQDWIVLEDQTSELLRKVIPPPATGSPSGST